MKELSKKLISLTLSSAMIFSLSAPAFAATTNDNIYLPNNNSISISYDELLQFEMDLYNMMKNDPELQSELQNIYVSEDRSAASSAAETAIKAAAKWLKKNGLKIWNKLPPKVQAYFAAQGAAGFAQKLIDVVDAYADISDNIDQFVYNVLRNILPSQVSDWWVDKITRTVRLLIPSPV